MKRFFCTLGAIAMLGGIVPVTFAADAPAAGDSASDTNASKQVRALVKKIEAKLQAGKEKESDFTSELKEFDTLIADLKSKAPEAAAEAGFMKALLYVQVFEDSDKATTMLQGVQKDYPGTKFGKQAEQVIASIERQAKGKKILQSLQTGAQFPDFAEKDLQGKPLSLADYKGKVLLVDFWATWCGPCRAELPNVLEAYNKYHSKGFDIVGISLDREEEALQDFIKKKEMKWRQYFDGKGWENKLAQAYGIQSIPATFLLDGNGKIIGRDLRGEDLTAAVEKALKK